MDSSANADDEPAGASPADADEGVPDTSPTETDTSSTGIDAESAGTDAESSTTADRDAAAATDTVDDDAELEALRAAVEEKYDFENFGPADMAKMTPEEWEAAFDADSWITGPRLLDRVETDLKTKVASRDIFAVLERDTADGVERLLAYSDEGYAVVSPDGTVEGQGGILRDVEPVVAMCSMEEYEVGEPPDDYQLPAPESVPEQTGEFGNLMLQIIAGMQFLGGIALILAWLLTGLDTLVAPLIGGLFAVVGFLLFLLVANARLSDRFRAEQYRNRLRAVEAEGIERPRIPLENDAAETDQDSRERETECV
jgi:hypothetical protein